MIKIDRKQPIVIWTIGGIFLAIMMAIIGSSLDNSPKELGIKVVLSPAYSHALKIKPRTDCLYKLEHVEIKQKVKDGYLIGPSHLFNDESDSDCQTAFLYNKGIKNEDEDFDEGYSLNRWWAHYVGTYEYQGKKLLAFKVDPDKEGYDDIIHNPGEVSRESIIDKDPSNMEVSKEMAVANFMCHIPNSSPEKNILYSLNVTEVMQSTTNGVLIRINTIMGPSSPSDIAFVYTEEKFVDGAMLNGRYAYHVGTYSYQTILGVGKNVYAFKLVSR